MSPLFASMDPIAWSWAAVGIVFGSAGMSAAIALATWVLGIPLQESTRNQITRLSQCCAVFASAALVALQRGPLQGDPLVASISWLPEDLPGARMGIAIDLLGASCILGVTTLLGVVQHFSYRYLHDDPGNPRFFFLLALFQLGMLLLIGSSHLIGVVGGWELVGVSSALLIAYFHERREPVSNALLAFGSYRVCDVGLLLASALLVHALGNPMVLDIGQTASHSSAHAGELQAAALLLVVASLGKSAQLPVSPWLPRAMEGPTPSSAIFYGALSIHAGAYLLVRASPILEGSPLARMSLIVLGATTAVYAGMVGRSDSDVKARLAHASMAQAGVVLAEIGLGLSTLAVWHLGAHACLRTWQILRAPSALHHAHGAAATGLRASALPLARGLAGGNISFRTRLYLRRLDRFGLDHFLRRVAGRPVDAAARLLMRCDPWSAPPAPALVGPMRDHTSVVLDSGRLR